jgi:hypothetical protein
VQLQPVVEDKDIVARKGYDDAVKRIYKREGHLIAYIQMLRRWMLSRREMRNEHRGKGGGGMHEAKPYEDATPPPYFYLLEPHARLQETYLSTVSISSSQIINLLSLMNALQTIRNILLFD